MAATKELLMILMPTPPDPVWVERVMAAMPGLEVQHRVTDYFQENDIDDITAEDWKMVTVLLTWRMLPTKEMAPNLKYVQLLSAGCNHLAGRPLFADPEVTFCTANGVHSAPITEWIFMCFLAFQRHLPRHLTNQKLHNWVNPLSDEDQEDAVGLRVGILGYGAIGRQTARVAKALGMDVYAYTLRERSTPSSRRDADTSFTEPGLGDPEGEFPSKWFHGAEQLHAFLSSDLDLLVILLPLTDQTRGMLSDGEFALLGRKKAYVCNAGRGAIVDTDALMRALDCGVIRGAALDVTDPEPLPSGHGLWGYENVIITPHVSGNTNHYYARACKILGTNLERRARGEGMVNVVDRRVGY